MSSATGDDFACPECGQPCERVEVDVGVGIECGPWGCGYCGWSADSRYDSRAGVVTDDDRVLDQWEMSHARQRPCGLATLARLNVWDLDGELEGDE